MDVFAARALIQTRIFNITHDFKEHLACKMHFLVCRSKQIVTEVVHEFVTGKTHSGITNNTQKWKKTPFSTCPIVPLRLHCFATGRSLIGDSQLITAGTDGCIYWSRSSTYFSSLNDTDRQIWPACVMDSEEPMTRVSVLPLAGFWVLLLAPTPTPTPPPLANSIFTI